MRIVIRMRGLPGRAGYPLLRSRLVLAPVAVTDASGMPVPGLEASDFAVLDNGRPQKIVVDSIHTGVPRIALVIAVQSSGISEAILEKARGSAR
jgi:hypothetical protein